MKNDPMAKKYRVLKQTMNWRAHLKGQLNITRADLEAIIKRDGLFCKYCGRPVKIYENNNHHADGISFDHKRSLATKGTNNIDNIVVCCHACNIDKNEIEQKMGKESKYLPLK